ncbi:hypothetical protein OSTOST_22577, partial [Ostertagia ostertagi]
MLRNLVQKIRTLLTPFMSEIKAARTKEDKKMEDRDAQLNNFAQRKALKTMMEEEEASESEQKAEEQQSLGMSKEKADKLLTSKPTWADFKTGHLVNNVHRRVRNTVVNDVSFCKAFGKMSKCYVIW